MEFEDEVTLFFSLAEELGLRYMMVGGGAVNFHGYRRHSADVDLWVEPVPENFQVLGRVLKRMGYGDVDFPERVLAAEQNISVNISPQQEIELITRFDPGCTFQEAWERSIRSEIAGLRVAKYQVIGYEDLIQSKVRSGRPKDHLDILELQRLRGGAKQ
jgi:hypothetical protein